MELIDSHCHLDFTAFDPDREAVLTRSAAAGVVAVVVPGTTAADWGRTAAVAAASPALHPAFGLHPLFMDQHRPEADLDTLASRLAQEGPGRAVAVGEIGLDLRAHGVDQAAQEALLDAQLALAAERELPVIIHAVRAHHRLVGRLRRWKGPGGVIHAFNGSPEDAHAYIDAGFRLGIGGLVTWPRNRRLRALVAELPLRALLLETDAPDMAPADCPSSRNSPEYLPRILAEVAALRGEDEATVAAATSAGARMLFGLGD